MGEDVLTTPEQYYEPVEVKFGDIVQVIRHDGHLGKGGLLVVETSETSLTVDDVITDDDGNKRILPTGGTLSEKVVVTGNMEEALPLLIQALKDAGTRFNVPDSEIEGFIEEARAEATKGSVLYSPPRPRTEEEQAEIDRQLKERFPNFFKGSS